MVAEVPRHRIDSLPEGKDYEDTGCFIHPSCLDCPLTRCIHELPSSQRNALILEPRNAEVRKLYDAGMRPPEVARELGVSRRTVYRVLRITGGLGRR